MLFVLCLVVGEGPNFIHIVEINQFSSFLFKIKLELSQRQRNVSNSSEMSCICTLDVWWPYL
jgi:hypothetical protein